MEKIKLTPQLMTEEMKKRLMEDMSVYEELDLEASMIYIVMTYKHNEDRVKVLPTLPQQVQDVIKEIEAVTVDDEGKSISSLMGLSFSRVFAWMKKMNSSREEMQYVLDLFSPTLQKHVTEWGFWFLKDTRLKAELI